mgnify:CR=1 FL=1
MLLQCVSITPTLSTPRPADERFPNKFQIVAGTRFFFVMLDLLDQDILTMCFHMIASEFISISDCHIFFFIAGLQHLRF